MQPTGWIARSMHLAQRCRAARVAVGGAIVVAAQALATDATPDGPALVLTSVEVRAVSRVEPGAELAFSVHANPGARVRLRIDGASQALRLAETAPGLYQGTYIVAARDRIGPRSKLALKLRHERGMQTARVGRPLQVDWPEPASAIDTTHIDSVAVVAEDRSKLVNVAGSVALGSLFSSSSDVISSVGIANTTVVTSNTVQAFIDDDITVQANGFS